MAQKLFEDKIGALSHNAGIISMLPSKLTIGGQQYITTVTTQYALPALTANTLYMIYAVQTGGVVSLVQSVNVNSVGPGNASWKLVGAYYANGLVSVGFGSFVNIEGAPETSAISHIPTSTWIANTTHSGRWRRKGVNVELEYLLTLTGAPTAVILRLGMPTNQTIDSGFTSNASNIGSMLAQSGLAFDTGVNSWNIRTRYVSSSLIECVYAVGAGTDSQVSQVAPNAWNTGDFIQMSFSVPVSGWTNIPLKDL